MYRTTPSPRPACATTFLLFAALGSFAYGQSFTTLHTFQCTDGNSPYSGLSLGKDGDLYGTTSSGGSVPAASGTVYRISTAGKFKLLHNFTGGNDGLFPTATPIQDAAGNLYGTTGNGGPADAGVVWKITAAGHESVLYSFTGGSDGRIAYSDLIRDAKGNLYGVTAAAGDQQCAGAFGLAGCGTVYKVNPAGKETVIHTFEGSPDDGSYPIGGLVRDSAGNLYGTTYFDGLYGAGQVFKIDTGGNKTTIHDFDPGTNNDGANPDADLAFSPGGVLYGIAGTGGDLAACSETGPGCGVVFKIDTNGVLSTIHSFEGQPSDGSGPDGPVARDSAGNLYGVTYTGGVNNIGTVYKLDASGNVTILHNFTGGSDGFAPHGRIYVSGNGTVYGTTSQGGSGCGVVYKIAP